MRHLQRSLKSDDLKGRCTVERIRCSHNASSNKALDDAIDYNAVKAGTLKVFLTTDASKIGMGVWIVVGTTKENAQPVAYDSRSFNSAQRNYSTHELELLAIVHPHDRWRPFLYCIPVYVFRLNGVIGNGEALLGHTKLSVTLGGVTTDHIFWIGESVATLILGSPFILKNKVEVVWASDNRRLLRQKFASASY